jgi:hypothetical protein
MEIDPAVPAQYLPLVVEGGHLVLSCDGQRLLVDTGAPISVHPEGRLSLGGVEYDVATSYLGLTIATLSDLADTRMDALLGMDLLGSRPFTIDLKRGGLTFNRTEYVDTVATLPLREVMGVPVVEICAAGQTHRVFLDSGAKVSYLKSSLLAEHDPIVEIDDFYPGVGRFRTVIHQVRAEIGGQPLVLNAGALPPLLEMTLLLAGVNGILGMALFEGYVSTIDMAQSKLVLEWESTH